MTMMISPEPPCDVQPTMTAGPILAHLSAKPFGAYKWICGAALSRLSRGVATMVSVTSVRNHASLLLMSHCRVLTAEAQLWASLAKALDLEHMHMQVSFVQAETCSFDALRSQMSLKLHGCTDILPLMALCRLPKGVDRLMEVVHHTFIHMSRVLQSYTMHVCLVYEHLLDSCRGPV